MRFAVLGPLEIHADDGSPVVLRRRKPQLLLAALLLAPQHQLGREALVAQLWGDRSPSSALPNLRSYTSELRRSLRHGDAAGVSRLVCHGGRYQLRISANELDLHHFEQLAEDGAEALSQRRYADAAELLERAVALWRSDVLLNGLSLPDDLWASATRLQELRVQVIEDGIEARLALGRHHRLENDLHELVARYPLRERLWEQLIRTRYRRGQRARALAAYAEAKQRLADELGVEPGPRLQRLHTAMLHGGDVPAAGDDAWDAPSDRVSETVTADPPPRRLAPTIADFTGRREQLDVLASALPGAGQSGAAAIVAITGAGGVGKTTLALQFAHRVANHFPDGQLQVDLHGYAPRPPTHPIDSLAQLLRALGVADRQIPDNVDEAAGLYRDRLAGRQTLVLLDNAADEQQLHPLLPATDSAMVLVTSRRTLAIDGATQLALDVFTAEESMALLSRIAGDARVQTDPVAAAQLAELCGYLPLAVALAAARLRSRPAWPCSHLVARLRDHRCRLAELSAGNRSVKAAFSLSYAALTPAQQRVFRLLGSHSGDMTAASTATLAGLTHREARQILEDLLDQHLLYQQGPDRYHIHDLLRMYAAHLAAGGDGDPPGDLRPEGQVPHSPPAPRSRLISGDAAPPGVPVSIVPVFSSRYRP